MVEKSCELKQKRSQTKMDGGTKAVQAGQNFFQTPQYLHQIHGTSRLDGLVTGFAPDCRQSVLNQYLSKEMYSQLAGSTLPYAISNENSQNVHHGKSHQFGSPYAFANVRPSELRQHPSGASRTLSSNQDYNSTASKETQFEYQQHQTYYAPLHYKHANNALPQSLSSQEIAYRALQSQATLANRPHAATIGLGQNTYGCLQPPSYAQSVATQMTLVSENQCPQLASGLARHLSKPHQKEAASFPKQIEGQRPPFPLNPMEVERQLHLQSQYMKFNTYAQTLPRFPSATQNGFGMIPDRTPNTIHYLGANGYNCPRVASDPNVSSKESAIPSPRSELVGKENESYASIAFQLNTLHPAVGDGQMFATSKSSAIDQNSNATGTIPVQGSPVIDGLNIAHHAKNTVDRPLNSIDLSTVNGNSKVTSEDIINLREQVLGMREQFICLLMNYEQKYKEFRSVNGDRTLPISHEHGSNLLKSNDDKVPGANRPHLLDNTLNVQGAPATFSSQSNVLMMNSSKANHNSQQDCQLNQTSLDSMRESNGLDKVLHVMKDAPASLPSTIEEKPNLNKSQVKNCQQYNNNDILLVNKAPHAPNQKLDATGKEMHVIDSKKAPKRRKIAADLTFVPKTAKTAMRQLKDLSLLDDQWKNKPCKDSQINLQMCPNLDLMTISSSETFHDSSQPVEAKRAIINDVLNYESNDQGNIPLVQKISSDVQEAFTGQLKQNAKDMSLSHHYRTTINTLLDKLDSYSTINSEDTEEIGSVDTEEMGSVNDSSKSETVKRIKTEPCESVTENAKVNSSENGKQIKTEPCESEIETIKAVSSEYGNVMRIKTESCKSMTENTKADSSEYGNVTQIMTDTCETVINTKSFHLGSCIISEPQCSPSCLSESSQFQARDAPFLLVDEVPEPPLKIENICSLVEGNTFYSSQVARVFGTNNIVESKAHDTLSNNIVTPQAKVESNVLPNSQCFDSKGLSDLPQKNDPHSLQAADTKKREEDFSHIQEEHGKQLSLSTAQPLENICTKNARSEPSLYSQLSELLRAYPFGIEQTESAPVIKVDEVTEKKGMNSSQLSKKQIGQNVQKSKIFSQKSFPAQSLINKSSSIALDKCGSTEIPKELLVQIDNKHSSVDKCDSKKSATVGHISVTVVDSKKIIINVIESPTEADETTSIKNNRHTPNFHSAMTNIFIEANKKSLEEPCRKPENVLPDRDDEVVWVKTEAPPHSKSTTTATANKSNDSSVTEPLEKDVSLDVHPEISEKSNCKDSPLPKTLCDADRMVGCKKIKKKASKLIVRTDFLKSKYSRLTGSVKHGETKAVEQSDVEKGCKNDKIGVANLPSDYTDSGVEKKPETRKKGVSSAAEVKLSIDNVCAGKTHKDTEVKSDSHNDSAFSKANTRTQIIQEYFQRQRENMSAGKKVPKVDKEAIPHNTNPLTAYRKPSVDLGRLKQIVMQASEIDLKENVSKNMQTLEMTENNMPSPTAAKVLSPTSGDLKLGVKPNRQGSPENNPTSRHIVGANEEKEMSGPRSTKSTEPTGTDFIKRVAYLGRLNGIIQLSVLDFPLFKESDRRQKQGSFSPSLTKKPETSVLQSVTGKRQMRKFKLCPDLLMVSHLAGEESTKDKHPAQAENGSQKGIGSETEDCSNVPFKKRKVDMVEYHGSVVLQQSTVVGQTTCTAEKSDPTATSSSQDLFNVYKNMHQEKQDRFS